VVTPEVRMFWQHETLEDSPWVASRFASGAGGVFRVRGPRLGRDSLVGSGSVTVQLGEKWSGYAAYTGEFLRANAATHRVNLGLRMEFGARPRSASSLSDFPPTKNQPAGLSRYGGQIRFR
jgi:uncharacterized protein with beta-barrel porin domain